MRGRFACVEEHAFWARILTWNDFPGLPSEKSVEVFAQLRRAPRASSSAKPGPIADDARLPGYATKDRIWSKPTSWHAGGTRGDGENPKSSWCGGAYPGMGTGDPDLYKAFCWRFWHLTMPSSEGGRPWTAHRKPVGVSSALRSTRGRERDPGHRGRLPDKGNRR